MPVEPVSVDLQIQRAATAVAIPEDEKFLFWAGQVAAHAGMEHTRGEYTLTIRIVDEEEGRRFNQDYRRKDHATNVLSFPFEFPDGLPPEVRLTQLGDLLICAPVVEREAVEQGKEVDDHWAHLTIHGILHLIGYDHEQTTDAVVMETLETDILAGMGIPDPYLQA